VPEDSTRIYILNYTIYIYIYIYIELHKHRKKSSIVIQAKTSLHYRHRTDWTCPTFSFHTGKSFGT
jgi:hypothetical protein